MVPVSAGNTPADIAAKAPRPSCSTMMSTCPRTVYTTPTVVAVPVPNCPVPTAAEMRAATPPPPAVCPVRPLHSQRRVVSREPAPARECTRALFGQLTHENDQTRDLMASLNRAQACQFADLYAQLRTNVVTHIRAQQEILHSATLESPTTRYWTLQSAEAQQAVLSQICALDQTAPTDDLWKVRYDNLAQMIGRSNFIEQKKLWPAVAPLLNEQQCYNLCAAYNAQRAAVLASLPPYAVVAQTTFYPANCFAGRTVTTSAAENASMTTPSNNQQQK